MILIAVAAATTVVAQAAASRFDEADAWEFPAADDSFRADALNLRALLNEQEAGQSGFVRLSPDGASFVDGAGRPLRFWSVVSDGFKLDPVDMERHAAWLAKRGVNMVRAHANLSLNIRGAKVTDVDRRVIDGILHWVAICKRHGIYVTISPYWPWWTVPASWGIEGYADDQPWGLMYFNPQMQEGLRAWLRALYTTPNPYANGVPLKDEPTVAIAQVMNEDSLLFHTFDEIKAPQKRLLGSQFAAWAAARYGSVEQAVQAWGGAALAGDDLPAGVLGFHRMADYSSAAPRPQGPAGRRLSDQLEFITEKQRAFYGDIDRYLKSELGVKSLTNAMNWRSSDPVTLDDVERYTYTATDISAVNWYVGGVHIGENNLYRIDPGQRLTNGSVLNGTSAFSGALKRTAGHPMIVTETQWVRPNLYEAEGPFLIAAYTSMNGVASTYWMFYAVLPEWQKDMRNSLWPSAGEFPLWKWYGNDPLQGGQFPALALAFRRGYIAPAKEPAVYEERSLQDLWSVRIPIISESGRFDPARDKGAFAPDSPVRQEVDRNAFFVGPVVVRFGGDASHNRVIDLAKYIDTASGDIRSTTGELTLNTRRGLATINAPKISGVCGFLRQAGGVFALGETEWKSSNNYAALVAVSLDGADLAASRRILVQAGTLGAPRGFTVVPKTFQADGKTFEGEEIVTVGGPPLLIAKTHATLSLANPHVQRGVVLDENLYPRREVPVRREGRRVTVELPPDALYLMLE